MRFIVSLVILNLCEFYGIDARDWCKIPKQRTCRHPEEHIFCRFPDEVPRCSLEYEETTTDKFRRKMLDMHNDFRNKWAGGQWPGQREKGLQSVSNMKYLSWDKELESLARRNLLGCVPGHEGGCNFVDRFTYGQNFVLSYSKRSDIEAEFAYWTEEFKNFNPRNIKPFESGDATGHFTALAWADTALVGCVEANYKTTSDSPFWKKGDLVRKLVCDYGPGGNLIGGTMYEEGPPCSKCPNDCGKGVYKNLCGSVQPEYFLKSRSRMRTIASFYNLLILFLFLNF